MKVLHTVRSLDPKQGGPSRSVPLLAHGQCGVGIDARIWANGTASALCSELDVPIEHGDLRSVLDREQWDVHHDHGLWLSHNRVLARHCRRRGTTRVVSPRGMLEPWALEHHRWRKRIAWSLFQRRDLLSAAGLHASSVSETHRFRALGYEGDIGLIRNGVEMPPDGKTASFDGPPTVVFLGRLHPVKGLDVLAEAWPQAGLDGWRMEVIGPDEGGYRSILEGRLDANGVRADWTFTGPVNGQARWDALRRGHIFVLPSHSENFGIAVAEAMAAGLPVITTKGTPWQGAAERGCGRWVDLDPSSLATALGELTSLPTEDLREKGMIGHQWMQSEFAWLGASAEMQQFYLSLLERDPRE